MAVIYLSPSTQKGNIGVGDYGTEEERMNQVADHTERVLKEHGHTVHRNDRAMGLREAVAYSNSLNPDLHLAIHSNAMPDPGTARGAEIYCLHFGTEGEEFAKCVYEELEKITPTPGRGVKEGHSHFGPGVPLYELANTTAVSALVEVAFHDQPEDAEWIMANIEEIGIALAKGILAYLETPCSGE
ncbi:MAG: N-acetylmuramoyl-L-alanine amidase family protein [Bacillota bacterium]